MTIAAPNLEVRAAAAEISLVRSVTIAAPKVSAITKVIPV